jgi:hypothetical protein
LRFPPGGAAEGEVVVGSKQKLERPWGVCQDATGAIYVSDERQGVVLKVEAPSPLGSPPAQKAATPKQAAPTPAAEQGRAEDPDALD